MNTPALLIGCAGVGVLALTGMGLALARGAALADARAPHPSPIPHPAPALSSTDARALDAHEIRARALADSWHCEGRLSPAGYLRLCDMMYAGLDVYPYWSGGALHGTTVVWDGTRGRAGERLTVEEWNADAEHATGAQDGARGGAA